MARLRLFLRALVAWTGPATVGVALCLPLPLALDPAAPASAAAAASGPGAGVASVARVAAEPVEPDLAPLRVTISSMSKATLPARGNITVRGTVTNRSEETWTTVKLYTFLGSDLAPMNDPAALDAAMDVPYDAPVGERLVTVGEPGLIEVLEPGEKASYVVKVPVSEFDFPDPDQPDPGVYWFGVHALGQGGSLGRDNIADGRARTFLPVAARDAETVPAALVVPMVHRVLYDGDGSLAKEDHWEQVLAPGGRLHDLLTLGQAAAVAGVPLTWLVDPALLDAVAQLADGNAPRSLGPTTPVPKDSTDPPDPDPTGTPSPSPDEPTDAGEPLPETPAVLAARDWLQQVSPLLRRGEVLSLPYGNVDVGAVLQVDPALLDLARAQESAVLTALGVESEPVNAAPGGYLDASTVQAAPTDVPLLVSDRFLAAPSSGVAGIDGHKLIVTSSGAAQGSPGPGRSLTAVGVRQRLLAEAAVRSLPAPEADGDADAEAGREGSGSGQPLVVVLPTDWKLSTAEEFFDGLTPDWISFGSLEETVGNRPVQQVPLGDVLAVTDRRELEAELVVAAQELIAAGDTLQRVLVENTSLGARVTEEALSALSYSIRGQQGIARRSLVRSTAWLSARLGSIEIFAGPGVTLSGDSGGFVVTLTNKLDEAVTVSITALSDPDLSIAAIEPIELAADSRTTKPLDVTTTTGRVHDVTLLVTDVRGVPLGASDQLPIRSVLVSDVIWVIIGVGVGTLFLAILLRLRRRIIATRRAGPASTT